MKRLTISLILLLAAVVGYGQTIGEMELAKPAGAYGHKKLKDAPKRIYIDQFFINYQLMTIRSETAKGGRQLGGSYRGNATAQLVLGVPGISQESLQANTDRLYSEYVTRLKNEGFEIISPDEAGKTEHFAEFTRVKGGEINESQNPGFLATTPTGYEYFVKKINKKGRAKASIFDNGQKISKDLDGAIIARVTLNIPVFEDAESQGSKALSKSLGGVAKVVVRPNYRLATNIYVQTGKMSGAAVPTYAKYVHYLSVKKAGDIDSRIKKDVEISGVFENKKYKAVETADVQHTGTAMGSLTLFRVDNRTMEVMQEINCDPDKYIKGAYEVSSAYLNKTMDRFIAATKGEKIK